MPAPANPEPGQTWRHPETGHRFRFRPDLDGDGRPDPDDTVPWHQTTATGGHLGWVGTGDLPAGLVPATPDEARMNPEERRRAADIAARIKEIEAQDPGYGIAYAYGALGVAAEQLLATWNTHTDDPDALRLAMLTPDVNRLADTLAQCREGLHR